MRLEVPELNNLPADQRQALLDEATRRVTETHGRMGNTPHYVGCVLTSVIVISLAMAGRGLLLAVLLSAPAYFGAMAIGVFLWRRSMGVEAQRVVRQLASERAEDGKYN